MAYNITYKKSVVRDLKHIEKSRISKIINKLESQLSQNPLAGQALAGEFEGLYRIRIGDYRIIYSILKDSILILRIAHRKDSYQ